MSKSPTPAESLAAARNAARRPSSTDARTRDNLSPERLAALHARLAAGRTARLGRPPMPNRLAELRKALGLSVASVSLACGVRALVSVEKGKRVAIDAALKLSEFYGLTVNEIWSLPKPPGEAS